MYICHNSDLTVNQLESYTFFLLEILITKVTPVSETYHNSKLLCVCVGFHCVILWLNNYSFQILSPLGQHRHLLVALIEH